MRNMLICIWFKGSVSRQVRHRLLYIVWKLFLKPLSADHFYLFLLKGYPQFTFKISAFSEHFTLNMLFILKKLSSTLSGLWSGNEWQNTSSLCSEPKIANRTYIISSKENVHRMFPFEEIMYGKTPLAFKPNIQTSKAMARCWAWNQHSSKELVLWSENVFKRWDF